VVEQICCVKVGRVICPHHRNSLQLVGGRRVDIGEADRRLLVRPQASGKSSFSANYVLNETS